LDNSLKRSIQALAVERGDWIIITELDFAVNGIPKNILAKIIVDRDTIRISPEQKDIIKIPVGDAGKIMICWKVRPEKDQATTVTVSLLLDEECEQAISTTLPPKATMFKKNLH
jgi:hypothetical protein